MNRIGRTLWLARIPSLSAFSSFVTATVASLALLRWMSDNQLLRGFSQPVAMNPTVAAALIAAAAALWLSRGHRGPIGPKIGTGLALLVLLAAFAKLFSYATGWGIPLDTGLFRSELSGNEMAPNSAVGLLLASSAIILLGKRFRGGYEPATWLASVSAGISLVAMAGYYNGLSSLFGIGAFIPMALNTALAVFVLSVGIVWSSAHGTP